MDPRLVEIRNLTAASTLSSYFIFNDSAIALL